MGKTIYYIKGYRSPRKVSALIYISTILFIAVLFTGRLTQGIKPVVAQSSDYGIDNNPAGRVAGARIAAANSSYELSVLNLKYFPVAGGQVDTTKTGDWQNPDLNALRNHVSNLTNLLSSSLTRASAYRGYKDPGAVSSLVYSVLDDREFLSPVPVSSEFLQSADHKKILNDINICDYVDNRGVKEVWIWMYHTSTLAPIESNMSMGRDSQDFWTHGSYGDISNSARLNDLPVCQKSYTVYDYNYGRGLGEALEDHAHQLEAIFSHLNNNLFSLFTTPYGKTDGTINRCGNAHNPPNSRHEYDWANLSFTTSDCEDWRPEGFGATKQLNCVNWTPGNPTCQHQTDYLQDANSTWKIYWMQNMPGQGNALTYQGKVLRNWWEFVGDFDSAMRTGQDLVVTPSNTDRRYLNRPKTRYRHRSGHQLPDSGHRLWYGQEIGYYTKSGF